MQPIEKPFANGRPRYRPASTNRQRRSYAVTENAPSFQGGVGPRPTAHDLPAARPVGVPAIAPEPELASLEGAHDRWEQLGMSSHPPGPQHIVNREPAHAAHGGDRRHRHTPLATACRRRDHAPKTKDVSGRKNPRRSNGGLQTPSPPSWRARCCAASYGYTASKTFLGRLGVPRIPPLGGPCPLGQKLRAPMHSGSAVGGRAGRPKQSGHP